jgi:hypothetical protein
MSENGEKGVSLAQLEKVIRRMRHARPGDPDFIPRRLMDRFLDGHLLDENPHDLARIVSVGLQIARLIGTLGMDRLATWPDHRHGEDYSYLWPSTVYFPLVEKFKHVALIDSTVSLEQLVEAGRVRIKTSDREAEQLLWPDEQPEQIDEYCRSLRRYVIFTSLTSNNGLDIKLGDDQETLSLLEAVQLAGQSGGQFLLDGFYILGQSEPVAAWVQMGVSEEDPSRANVVEVTLSRLKTNNVFTHNVLVRSRHVTSVD